MRRLNPRLRQQLPPEFFVTDDAMRLMVGTLVVNHHPEGVDWGDLVYELSRDDHDSSVERAIRDLVSLGILRCEGRRVFADFLPAELAVGPPPRRRRLRLPTLRRNH